MEHALSPEGEQLLEVVQRVWVVQVVQVVQVQGKEILVAELECGAG